MSLYFTFLKEEFPINNYIHTCIRSAFLVFQGSGTLKYVSSCNYVVKSGNDLICVIKFGKPSQAYSLLQSWNIDSIEFLGKDCTDVDKK